MNNIFIVDGVWYIRVKFLCGRKKIQYVVESKCFPFCGSKDLQFKLQIIETRDILLRPEYVLSLVVPFDNKDEWNSAIQFATALRKIAHDYRLSLVKFKTISQNNYSKRYSYVS